MVAKKSGSAGEWSETYILALLIGGLRYSHDPDGVAFVFPGMGHAGKNVGKHWRHAHR